MVRRLSTKMSLASKPSIRKAKPNNNLRRILIRIDQYKQLDSNFDPETLKKLKSSFLKLSQNPQVVFENKTPKTYCQLFASKQSLINNFKKVFGYSSQALAIRFYNYLSDGYNGKRIYLTHFCCKMVFLVRDDPFRLNTFSFRMLDSQKKGFV